MKNYLKLDSDGELDLSAIQKLKGVQFRKAVDDDTTPENEGGLENLRKAILNPLSR